MRARRGWLAFALFAAIYLYSFPYFGALRHANELPRVLTTQELVHHGTFELGERLAELGSRADISTTPDGRHFQNKAPGLSVIGAAVYAPLALGYRVAGAGEPSLLIATWLLRVVVVTLPSLLFLAVFRRVAERFAGGSPLARDAAWLAYGLGSLALPYAIVFMSHAPATAAVGAAFALASRLTRGEARAPTRAALAIGALLGLAMFVEYQAIFAAIVLALFVAARAPRRARALGAITLGGAPFIVALAVYHAACFGSPFRTGYAYSVDEANRVGVLGIVGPSQESVLQLATYGSNGLLVLSPWILLAVLGAVHVLRDAERRARVGPEAIVASAIAAIYVLFVASLEPEFGRAGWSVGPRYLAVAMPFLGWLAAAGIAALGERDELRLPALVTVVAAIVVNVLAATTYPHWPVQFSNPLFEVSLRLLEEGHAPRSIGTLLGLHGWAAVAPVYALVMVLVGWLLVRAGLRKAHLAIVAIVAVAATSRFRSFPATPEPARSQTWGFVVSTFEPK